MKIKTSQRDIQQYILKARQVRRCLLRSIQVQFNGNHLTLLSLDTQQAAPQFQRVLLSQTPCNTSGQLVNNSR
nr:hypothetical protein BgiMline_024365 [Biomphalaria glabrata]